MDINKAFNLLPLSEQTIIRHKFKYKGLELRNDTNFGSCFYRVLMNGEELGAVKYYKGRKLCGYSLKPLAQ